MRTIERFDVHEVGPRDWGKEILVAQTPYYTGKVLLMNAGTHGGLQVHRQKEETFFLYAGDAIVITDKGDGLLVRIPMKAGEAFHIPPGAVHQVEATTDCVFFEASTPHFNDRVRLEAQYGLPEDGGLPTTERLEV